MSNALSVLSNRSSANLPAHLREALEADHGWDGVGGMAIPRIEVADRRIKAILNGTEVASSKDPITVVLVKPGAVGRTFYAKEYTKGEKAKPDCFSIDGIKPANESQNPQSRTCDTCEQNIKGSSKTMANAKACRYRQNLAVWLPGDKTWDKLFRISLPATAIFPDEENADGFRPLNKYVKELRAASATPSMVWTQIAIDDFQDQPRLLFKVVGWVDNAEDFAQVKELMHSPDMEAVLNTAPEGEDAAPANAIPGARPAHIDTDGVDSRRTRRSEAEVVAPTEWPDAVHESDFDDTRDTYWYHDASDSYFMVPAGEVLPDEASCEELSKEVFFGDYAIKLREEEDAREKALVAQKKAEDERRAREEARRVEEELRRQAEEDAAAAAAATSTRRRRGADPEPEPAPTGRRSRGTAAAEPEPAPTGRRSRGTAAAEPEPTPTPEAAPAGRRRGVAAAAPEPEPTPEAAPAGRRRGAAAAAPEPEPTPEATPAGPVSRRRQAVAPGGGTPAPAPAPAPKPEPEPEGEVVPPRRAAAEEPDAEAPAGRTNANLAALENIILAENADD